MAATNNKRQPVDQPLRHGYLFHRDAIWAAIRTLKTEFTMGDIQSQARVNKDTIKTYVTGLMHAGYLERLDPLPYRATPGAARIHTVYRAHRYTLIKDVGVDAPRVTREGKPVTQGLARENMWRTMRIIGVFNLKHLVVQASTEQVQIKEQDAKDYIKYLKAAGYICIKQKRQPGRSTVYRFLPSRYTGPKPPLVQKVKQVFDPNLGKVVWPSGGQS